VNRIQELYIKYDEEPNNYEREEHEYFIRGHCVDLIPASDKQIEAFLKNCDNYRIPVDIKTELINYYKQNNNIFNH